jgi:gamma-glutamylcyclotransferase (GGCT)/AIG2-like uncharacterized protein YtfP
MENQLSGECYAICYIDGHLVAIANPPNNKLDGFVYGTMQNHTNPDSAIAEYRQYVQANTLARDAESYAEEVLKRLPHLEELATALHSQCETFINICHSIDLNRSSGECYGICYINGRLFPSASPPNNKLNGFVYGTIQNHTNSDSAIAEYRQYVQANTLARDAESYAEEVLKRLPHLEELARDLYSRCETFNNKSYT